MSSGSPVAWAMFAYSGRRSPFLTWKEGMPISRREARELMSRGYEMRATVLNGTVRRQGDGTWVVNDRPLDEVLSALEGQEVTIVAAAVSEGPGVKRLCRVCGTEYEGHACPRCREIHQRLRGHA
jgi:hypothetical protein